MSKFYRKLPSIVVDILAISDGWLVGSSIEDILNNKVPNDFDIIVPSNTYRYMYRLVHENKISINNHGGLKIDVMGISIDIWIDNLDHFIKEASKFSYAYNFTKDKLITISNK